MRRKSNELAALKWKLYSYLTDDNDEKKKKTKQKAQKSVPWNANLPLKIMNIV